MAPLAHFGAIGTSTCLPQWVARAGAQGLTLGDSEAASGASGVRGEFFLGGENLGI